MVSIGPPTTPGATGATGPTGPLGPVGPVGPGVLDIAVFAIEDVGLWVPPSNTAGIWLRGIGGGGGGGSGSVAATGTNGGGGGGGQAGVPVDWVFIPREYLDATISGGGLVLVIHIGDGGDGGPAKVGAGNGNNGTAGGITYVTNEDGSVRYLHCPGGDFGNGGVQGAVLGTGGEGGATMTVYNDMPYGLHPPGGRGGWNAQVPTDGLSNRWGPASGAGGGGYQGGSGVHSTTIGRGASGNYGAITVNGSTLGRVTGPTTEGTDGGNGPSNGRHAGQKLCLGGGSGAGGAESHTGNLAGGDGGNGGDFGAGGSGGGCKSVTSGVDQTSGKGGDGAPGVVECVAIA